LVEKILGRNPLFSKDNYRWFGSNITLRLHLREISQLMESYPQLIPNITKVVELLKSYK